MKKYCLNVSIFNLKHFKRESITTWTLVTLIVQYVLKSIFNLYEPLSWEIITKTALMVHFLLFLYESKIIHQGTITSQGFCRFVSRKSWNFYGMSESVCSLSDMRDSLLSMIFFRYSSTPFKSKLTPTRSLAVHWPYLLYLSMHYTVFMLMI